MPLSRLHQHVASVTLRAARQHGFALGGGNALIAHEIISRPTQDIDLVTDVENGVGEAAGAVEDALRREGFTPSRKDRSSDLADLFPGLGDELADYHVTAPGGQDTELQLAYFGRSRDPVPMDLGPVLALEDVAGSKVCALAGRREVRDLADTAALMSRFTAAELITLARRLDSGLDPRDLAGVPAFLDQVPDTAFARYGLTAADVASVRLRFADWPRTAEAAGGT